MHKKYNTIFFYLMCFTHIFFIFLPLDFNIPCWNNNFHARCVFSTGYVENEFCCLRNFHRNNISKKIKEFTWLILFRQVVFLLLSDFEIFWSFVKILSEFIMNYPKHFQTNILFFLFVVVFVFFFETYDDWATFKKN